MGQGLSIEGARPSVRVRVEVPLGSFLKREGARVEFRSPLPCPFNYGSVVGTIAQDGDPVDAIVLGARLLLDMEVDVDVHAVVDFEDDGVPDRKLLCGAYPPSEDQLVVVRAFFALYAPVRALLNRRDGRRGRTSFHGIRALRDGDLP